LNFENYNKSFLDEGREVDAFTFSKCICFRYILKYAIGEGRDLDGGRDVDASHW